MKTCGNCFNHCVDGSCAKLKDTYMVSFQTEGEEKRGQYEVWTDYQKVTEVFTDDKFGCVLWVDESYELPLDKCA
jgi:hypothetical protein